LSTIVFGDATTINEVVMRGWEARDRRTRLIEANGCVLERFTTNSVGVTRFTVLLCEIEKKPAFGVISASMTIKTSSQG
jgi:hypothetical protein